MIYIILFELVIIIALLCLCSFCYSKYEALKMKHNAFVDSKFDHLDMKLEQRLLINDIGLLLSGYAETQKTLLKKLENIEQRDARR